MPDLYALLVGIDDYDDRARSGIRYPKLAGCVRDIEHVHAYLRETQSLDDSRVVKLTAPLPGAGRPEGDWPTKAALVAAFEQLLVVTQPGDQIYIHYAGHGGRASTVWPALKGSQGRDEALVPVDIGSEAGEYLRDVEIHALIEAFVQRGVGVTVVFDSCHSGGATRDDTPAVPRGIDAVDAGPRPHTTAVAGAEALWQPASGARGLESDSHWLLEPRGYTLIAACRATESAYEHAFDGRERNGALTYFLLETLRLAGPNTTWRTLMDRVIGRVHGLFDKQTPQPQGEIDRLPFGGVFHSGPRGIRVLQVLDGGHSVRLQAGEAHGLTEGVRLRIYALGEDRTDPTQSIAEATIAEVESAESTATITTNTGPVESGQVAMVVGAANIHVRRAVGVALDDPRLRAQIEQSVVEHGNGFVVLPRPGETLSFRILLADDGGAFEIRDPSDTPLSHLTPVPIDEPGAAQSLARQVAHIARFRTVQEIAPPDSAVTEWLRAEIIDPPARAAGVGRVYGPGDRVKLRITNTRPVRTRDSREGSLNIVVLDLASDWSVTQIYPETGDFEEIAPGQTIVREFGVMLLEGETATVDILKVFATVATTDFRWLELPPLGTHWLPRSRTRNLADDPLAALYDQWRADRPTTRKVIALGTPGSEWTVDDITIRVEAGIAEPE